MAGTGGIHEFRRLIERSSLGTDGARRLRDRVPPSEAELVSRIIRDRDQLAACHEAGDREGALEAMAGLARAYHALGHDDEALALVPDPASIYHEAKAGDRAWALATRAAVCQMLGRAREAERLCQTMLAACHAAENRDDAARALASLAVVFKTFGYDDQAQDLLAAPQSKRDDPPAWKQGSRPKDRLLTPSEIAALFRVAPKTVTRAMVGAQEDIAAAAAGMPADSGSQQRAAETLAKPVSPAQARRPPEDAEAQNRVSLTAREREILHLAAAGLSPRAIADALCISSASARASLRRIYLKFAGQDLAHIVAAQQQADDSA